MMSAIESQAPTSRKLTRSAGMRYPRLGIGKVPKDRERVVAHRLFEIRVREASPDLDPGPVMFNSVSMDVTRAGIMPMQILLMSGQGQFDGEAVAPATRCTRLV